MDYYALNYYIHSFNEFLLITCYVPVTVLGAMYERQQWTKYFFSILMKIIFEWRETMKNKSGEDKCWEDD